MACGPGTSHPEVTVNSQEESATVIIEKERGSELGPFILGALVGAGLALLFAPQTGKETQEQLRERARRLRDVTEERVKDLRDTTGERVKDLRDDFGSRVDSARDLVDRGRQSAAETRAELEARLERSKAAARAGIAAAREVARGEDEGPALAKSD